MLCLWVLHSKCLTPSCFIAFSSGWSLGWTDIKSKKCLAFLCPSVVHVSQLCSFLCSKVFQELRQHRDRQKNHEIQRAPEKREKRNSICRFCQLWRICRPFGNGLLWETFLLARKLQEKAILTSDPSGTRYFVHGFLCQASTVRACDFHETSMSCRIRVCLGQCLPNLGLRFDQNGPRISIWSKYPLHMDTMFS